MADPKNPKASHDDDLDVLGEIAEVEQLLPEPAAAPPGPAHDDADDGGVDPLGDFGLGESMDAPTDEDSGTGAGANGHAAASDAIGASLAETDALPDEVLAFDGEGRTQPDVGPSDELEEPHARTAREDSEAGATAEAGDASGAGVAQRRGDDEGHGAGPASTPEPPGAGAPHAPTYAVRRHDSSGFPMPASHADGDGATPSPGVYQSHESLVERVSAAPPRARAKTSPPPPPRRAQTSAAAVTRRADMTAATPSVAGAVRETTRGPIADPLAGDEPPPLAGATFGDGDYDVEVEQAGAPTSEAAPAATSTAPAPTSRASAPAAAPSIDALTGGAREDEDFEALMGLSFGGRPARRAPDAAPVQADAEVEIYIPEPGEGAPPQAPTDVTDGQHEAPPPPPGPGRMSLAERLRRSGALSELEADGEAADEGEVIAEADDAPTDLGDDPLTPMVPPDDALLAAAAAEPRMPPPPPSPAPRRAVPAPRPGGGPPVPPLPEGVWPRYVAELDMERAHRTSTEAAALAYEAQAASLAHVPGSDAEAARLATAASEASARFVPALYEAVHRALAAGNPAEAQRRLEAEIAATPDGGRRAWLEISRARIAEVVQHDDVAARAAWRRAAEAAPKETTPLVGVERMALAARDDAETLETWKKLGIEIRTNERKALYLVDFARLNERRGGDAELSIQALNRAFFADPADPFVLDELRATARRHERWGDVVATLAKEIGRLEQEEGRGRAVAEMHWRIAETYREHLGEAEAAWTSMEMALEFGPRHPAVLEAAVRMARGDATRAEAARRAFEALAESTAEPADRAAIWHELHVAAAAEWKDAALAEKALRAAVAADPPHRPSLLALEKLLLGAGRLGDLADVLASGAPPPGAPARDRAAHLVRLATLYHHHAAGGLGATDGATAAYGEALAADPGFFPAVAGLAAVLRREGRLPELEAHLTASLAASPARAEEIWLCDELAMLYRWEAPRLGGAAENAPQKAIESLARLGARDPERPRVLDRLAELHEQTGRWKELAELLEQGAAGQRDARARAALLLRAGRLRESRLDQTAAAAELYRAALDVAAAASAGERGGAPEGWATAGTVLAMAHLEPALATLHDESRLRDAWARVAEALRREARPDAAAQAAAAYLRVAELGGDAPEQSAAAAHALEAALELSPRSLTALRAAARRKEAAGDLTGAAVLREREAEALGAGAGAAAADGREPPDAAAVAGDARARALALLRAATLRDAADGAVSSADKAAAWARAADAAAEAKTHASAGAADAPAPATPAADEIALWALDRAVDVDAAAADWPAFAAHARALLAQEGLDARRRLALLLTLGLVQELALGDLDDARARYEVALELEPQSRAALRGLERVAERQGQWALAASAIERRAALAADPRAAAQLHVIAAEHKLQGRAEGAHDNYRRALDVFPDHPDAVLTLGEHYRRSGELGPLEAILARRLERAADPADKAMFLVQMGEVLEERGHLADARSRYAEALAAFPEHLPALAGMRRAAQRAGDGEAFVDVTQQLAKVVKAKPQAARLWRDAAAELEQLGRTDDAEKALVRALGLDPAEEGAFRHLRRLLRTRGDDAARLALLEKRTEHARSPQERATLLFEMADVQRRVLKRPATAAQTLAKAHAEDPANLDVAEYLGDVSCELGEWGDALEAYEAVVSGTDQPPRLRRCHMKLASLFENALPDPARAAASYRAVRALDPADTGVMDRLIALHLRTGQRTEAAEVLEARTKSETQPRARVELLERLAALYDQMGDARLAAERYADAYNVGPQHATGGRRLAQLWGKEQPRLQEVLKGAVAAYRFVLRKEPLRLETLARLADVLEWQAAAAQADRRLWTCDLLSHLGAATEGHARAAAELRARRAPQPAKPIAAVRERLVPDTGGAALRRLLPACREVLDRVMAQELGALGVNKSDRDDPRKRSALRAELESLAALVGAGDLPLTIFRGPLLGESVLAAVHEDGPVLIVGPDAVADDRLRPEARFQAARALAAVAGGWAGLLDVDAERAAAVCAALVRLGDPGFRPQLRADDVERAADKAASRKLRKALAAEASAAAAGWPAQFAAFLTALHEEADRVALLVTGQIHAALLVLTGGGRMLRDRGEKPAAAVERVQGSAEALSLVKFMHADEFYAMRDEIGLVVR